jgi:hypothetical protein
MVCDWIPIASGHARRKSTRIGRAASGKVQIGLLTDWDYLSQIGKGISAVNGVTLAYKRFNVKLEIFRPVFRRRRL